MANGLDTGALSECRTAMELREQVESELKSIAEDLASGSADFDDSDRAALNELIGEYQAAFTGSYSFPSSGEMEGEGALPAEEIGAMLLDVAADWDREKGR